MVPIYESMASLGPRVLRRLVWTALESLDGQIPERLPASVMSKNRLLDRAAPRRGAKRISPPPSRIWRNCALFEPLRRYA